ncbi:hypothetical protein WMY93_012019 [Mugilogobius chulae]|uniref:MRN complex-interacting protein N-terminal domain-containing protein n=1 Tax=Mugilogobius chulae TaxID=88201 RepID=A0AAW0P488_9GOBI
MVQEFHVLRCFSCEIFQVQQVKKVNKWTCKVCGQKQSVVKEFGRGCGADCRRHVQKLNGARGAKMEEEAKVRAEMDTQTHWHETEFAEEEEQQQLYKPVSRWDKYMPASQEEAGLIQKGAEPEVEEAVVLDRDLLYSNTQRAKRRETNWGQQWKRRRTSNQDTFRTDRSYAGPPCPQPSTSAPPTVTPLTTPSPN